MAKGKKTPKEASNLFHNIMKASVTNNTNKKMPTTQDIINGLKIEGVVEYFEFVEVVNRGSDKEISILVDYRLKPNLSPVERQKSLEAIVRVAQANGIIVTATEHNVGE